MRAIANEATGTSALRKPLSEVRGHYNYCLAFKHSKYRFLVMKNRATRTFYRNNGTVNVKLTSGKDINDERAERSS